MSREKEWREAAQAAVEFINNVHYEDGEGISRSKIGMEWPIPNAVVVRNRLLLALAAPLPDERGMRDAKKSILYVISCHCDHMKPVPDCNRCAWREKALFDLEKI